MYVLISAPLPLGIHTSVPYICDYACFANRIIHLTRPFLPSWSLLPSFLQASLSIPPLFLRLSSLLSSRLAGIPRRISWWDMNEGRKPLVLECISILCHKTPWNQFFNVMFCLYNCTCPPNKFSKGYKKVEVKLSTISLSETFIFRVYFVPALSQTLYYSPCSMSHCLITSTM